MDKLIIEVLRHLRAMWRYRWLGLITAWSVAVLSAVIVFAIPKKYEASARVFVNTDSILKPLMVGMTVQPDNSQRVALLSKMIISRPNVEQLIKETALDAKVKNAEQREKLIDNVIKVLDIQSSGEKDNIYVLKFRDTEPERAKHMVELLVSKFVNASQGGRANDTESAKQFLDEQAALFEKKLQETEDRLKEFKLANMNGMLANEGKDYFAQIAAAGEQLNQARLQLREAERSQEAYRHGLAAEDTASASAVGTNVAGESVADIDVRLDAMKRNLDSLLQRYTESHPDVVGARRVIQELSEQRSQLMARNRKAGVAPSQIGMAGGPRASEQLKVSLTQAEASVASLRARVEEYSNRYNQLRTMAERMPEYEAQLAQLNRDYEINKKNYESLVARRDSASMASDMQSVAGVADFRLIDPPRVSPNAVSAPRATLLAATLLLSLLAGGGIMFVTKEIRACFYDRFQLQEMTGLEIIGEVSSIANDKTQLENRNKLKQLALAAAVLFGIYVMVVVVGMLLTKPAV